MWEGHPLSRKAGRSLSVSLNYYMIAPGHVTTIGCPDCRAPLDIHQPNSNQPDQLLGTCMACGSWFRIEADEDEGKAMVVRLPECREFRTTESGASETP